MHPPLCWCYSCFHINDQLAVGWRTTRMHQKFVADKLALNTGCTKLHNVPAEANKVWLETFVQTELAYHTLIPNCKMALSHPSSCFLVLETTYLTPNWEKWFKWCGTYTHFYIHTFWEFIQNLGFAVNKLSKCSWIHPHYKREYCCVIRNTCMWSQ